MGKRTKSSRINILRRRRVKKLNGILKSLCRLDEYRNVPSDMEKFTNDFMKQVSISFGVPEYMLRGEIK